MWLFYENICIHKALINTVQTTRSSDAETRRVRGITMLHDIYDSVCGKKIAFVFPDGGMIFVTDCTRSMADVSVQTFLSLPDLITPFIASVALPALN
ncbi:uncharacterized [Tachysurus ichikawai]